MDGVRDKIERALEAIDEALEKHWESLPPWDYNRISTAEMILREVTRDEEVE
jgi:hypothetical protein